jgi:phosphatidate cytidylyltransferase
VLVTGALREYFAMAFPGHSKDQLWGVLFGLSLSLPLLLSAMPDGKLSMGLLIVLFFSLYLFMAGKLEERLSRLAWTLLGGVYLGYLLPHWVLLFRMPHGRAWVFFVLLVIMMGDTIAYFVGSRLGTRKLVPDISPGKTVEGALGYVAGSLIGGYLGARFLINSERARATRESRRAGRIRLRSCVGRRAVSLPPAKVSRQGSV